MIPLFPEPYSDFTCPVCSNTGNNPVKVIFQGIHLLADIQCSRCGFKYYQDFPIGQSITTPVTIAHNDLSLISPSNYEWFSQPLINSLAHPTLREVNIERHVKKQAAPDDKVIFFNCLDAWYGHVLLKLFNVQFYHDQYPSYRKIVLLPAGFTWMVPNYVDEIWSTDIRLRDTLHYFTHLEAFVARELTRYEVVYHSAGYSHPRLEELRTDDFFKTDPFNVNHLSSLPPIVTFVYREDRLWVKPFANRLWGYFSKRGLPLIKKYYLHRQVKKINSLAGELRKMIPEMTVYVCGMGKTGKFSNDITDLRTTTVDDQQELEWCRVYAKSQVVIGIHGSNMLIPSALSASWVEILPDDRLSNITQDLFCKHSYNNMSFLGRFASEYDPVKRIAGMIASIFGSFDSFRTQQKILSYGMVDKHSL